MFIDVKSANYNLHFEFDRRITVIKGDSGIGKTTLVELLQDDSYDVVKETSLPVVIAAPTTWQVVISGSKSSIIVFDDLECVETKEFSSLYSEFAVKNDLYFVVIGRADFEHLSMARLSYSIDSIYTIYSEGNQYYQKPFYQLPKYEGECDTVLVEDTTGGYAFFKQLFEQAATVKCSKDGKSSIVKDALNCTGKTLVVFDCAAFGCHIDEFCDKVMKKHDIVILSGYECFEELLARTNMLNQIDIIKDGLLNLPNSANNYLSWERFFENLVKEATKSKQYRYSHGAKLLHCYVDVCTNCNVFIYSKCDYWDKCCSDKFISLLKGTKYDVLITHRINSKTVKNIDSFS